MAFDTKRTTTDTMRIYYDVPIEMRDGIVLKADVFLPIDEGQYPALMTYGIYGKGQCFQTVYEGPWTRMVTDFPEIMAGSSNRYQNWETADPEKWVPHGYALVRIDSRGSGCSEGIQYPWSEEEIKDYYECIEWAGTQSWCDGGVGLLGISYYAANQWLVAGLNPPHLKAIVPWEGTSDWYRELFYHGGIRCTFVDSWLKKQEGIQYGYGDRGRKNPNTGENVAGAVTMSETALAKNRIGLVEHIKAHPLKDAYYDGITVNWENIKVPVLTTANWGGAGLHLRGNIEGFSEGGNHNRWLEVHGYEHWTHFYTDYGVDIQKRFLDHFLKGFSNGWDTEPRVRLQTRLIGNAFKERTADAWPLPNTTFQTMFLNAVERTLTTTVPFANQHIAYKPLEDEVTFYMPKVSETIEITGPVAATIYISSLTEDADLFLTLRLFDPEGKEVPFRGAMDANAPVAQGWLRASHRKLDPKKTLPYRPYHTHDVIEPLEIGKIYELSIEIWPTSIVIPPNYQLALTVSGKDYEFSGAIDESTRAFHRYPSKGCGPFQHGERSQAIYNGDVTIYTGKAYPSSILLPFIKDEQQS
ncbi:CocE/NonD family hydrolase [Fusibacter paucivorans]|uniref:CocE/NonD family hydrolase n=1 Tax=Fusibacter paucivorans TaxID=76009 RepID=A0ABS5PQJ5_9FIRM|nr:CocE/NonD family hydrolase [Fusibacter paucivorans]MBS7527445.1 CocE/NonD family hydrolase [Fusibacter paucivorans]